MVHRTVPISEGLVLAMDLDRSMALDHLMALGPMVRLVEISDQVDRISLDQVQCLTTTAQVLARISVEMDHRLDRTLVPMDPGQVQTSVARDHLAAPAE